MVLKDMLRNYRFEKRIGNGESKPSVGFFLIVNRKKFSYLTTFPFNNWFFRMVNVAFFIFMTLVIVINLIAWMGRLLGYDTFPEEAVEKQFNVWVWLDGMF